MKNYYDLSVKDALDELKSSESGITQEEALKRLQEYGENKLPKPKKEN